MADSSLNDKFGQLVQKIEPRSRLLRAWALKGGVSAQVTALEIAQPDSQTKKMIVRRHGAEDLAHNPHIAADEFKLLRLLHAAGLPAPAPVYVDASGEIFPTPCLVIEFIEGEPDFAPPDLSGFVRQCAATLARIHTVDGAGLDFSFLPAQDELIAKKLRERPARVDDSIEEGRIRDTLEAVWPPRRRNNTGLLHGDFWPGNLLWKDSRLTGVSASRFPTVIDWEDAKRGDPLSDLAISRLEFLWAFGIDAMREFTHEYQSLTAFDFANLPHWDLCASLRPAFKLSEWAADADAEKRMRERHALFVAQAYERLPVR